MGTWPVGRVHDGWEGYMQMEHIQLAERSHGKLRRAIGRILPGESREQLERIASEDQRMARAGLVKLKSGSRVYYKHIDELTREDRWARIQAEWETILWLRGRIEGEKITEVWRKSGWGWPDPRS